MTEKEQSEIRLQINKERLRREYNKIMKKKAEKEGKEYIENPEATGGCSLSVEEIDKYLERNAKIKKEYENRIKQETEKNILEKKRKEQKVKEEKKRKEQKIKEEKKLNFQANMLLIFCVLFFLFLLSKCSSSGSSSGGISCYSSPHGVICD